MRTKIAALLFFPLLVLAMSHGAFPQVGFGISVSFGPPPIPIYEQPVCPKAGYLWTPGYWAYDEEDGYYWVPGTWVEAPEPGYLWTPGYWGWNDGAYVWNDGYWGPEVGFYGGINYGFGYFGSGFGGGEWRGGTFFYNTAVVNVSRTTVTNVYENRTVIVNNDSHVAFNGGEGGVQARPTSREEQYSHQHHTPPVAVQTQQRQEARGNSDLRASSNHGKPPIAATAKAGDFRTGVVASREAGGEYHAPLAGAARGNGSRPGNENRANTESGPGNSTQTNSKGTSHASDLQPHQYPPPSSGNAADKKYQAQQEKLAAQQAKDHEKLQKQQDRDHQQAAAKNYNDTQKQQMERRHSQQTQQLEQKHAAQQKQMEERQAPKGDKQPQH